MNRKVKFYMIYRHADRGLTACKLGWSWPAFLFTGVWAIAKGCYRSATIAVITGIAVFPARPFGYLMWWILTAGYFGFEGNTFHRRCLMRGGYSHVATLGAKSGSEALERYKNGAQG